MITATDRDDFDELMEHPKYARIVADLVYDVNLHATRISTTEAPSYLDSETKETALQELG